MPLPPAPLRLLLDLLSQPTAPFREHFVSQWVTRLLVRRGVPHFADPHGNLVVGVGSLREYRARLRAAATREPVRLFIAHMDHPGFHGAEWLDARRLRVTWHGGSPVKHLRGAAVWLADADGKQASGTFSAVTLAAHGHGLAQAIVKVTDKTLAARVPHASDLFGGFQFRAPVWREGELIYAPAADDLVGVFAIIMTALAVRRSGAPFLGLLTRAEEVGFVGAVAHFELGWLQDAARRAQVIAVSLEASRTLPGAVIGRGPVVRVGDRRGMFSPAGVRVLSELATRVLPQAHQRRVMDGGSCEATAALAYGLPAIGISVPLGNYHNQGFEGGPDCRKAGGPAPEFVHLADVAGEIKLCRALLRPGLPWADAWAGQRRLLKRNMQTYKKLLTTS